MISGTYTTSIAQTVFIPNGNSFPTNWLISFDASCISNSVLSGLIVNFRWNDGLKNRLKQYNMPLILLSDQDADAFPVNLAPGQDLTIETILSTGLGSPSYNLQVGALQNFVY